MWTRFVMVCVVVMAFSPSVRGEEVPVYEVQAAPYTETEPVALTLPTEVYDHSSVQVQPVLGSGEYVAEGPVTVTTLRPGQQRQQSADSYQRNPAGHNQHGEEDWRQYNDGVRDGEIRALQFALSQALHAATQKEACAKYPGGNKPCPATEEAKAPCGDKPAAKEDCAAASKKPTWQVKVFVLQPFSRKRSGYVQTAKEETKTVCKECCVCCPVPPGCCPKCQKIAVLVEEKYYVPAIIKKDDFDLKYDGHAIKTVSIP